MAVWSREGCLSQIKIDVELYDIAAVWGMRRAIEEGLPPLWHIEYQDFQAHILGCRWGWLHRGEEGELGECGDTGEGPAEMATCPRSAAT